MKNDKNIQCEFIPKELLQELSKAGGGLVIGIPCERIPNERRVMLTPEAVDMLVECGHRVLLETNAGIGINYGDNYYAEAGAEIVSSGREVYQADLILKVLPPTLEEILMMRPRSVVFSFMQFDFFSREAYEMMMYKKITAFAYELICDYTGTSPIRTAISEIEGAASITVASELLSNAHGGKGILLGGIPGVPPTEVVIIGAGNTGTVAARAALALGALVKVFDNDIHRLRMIQQRLNQGVFTSTFHPNVLKNAFLSADVVIGANNYINVSHRYLIAKQLIRDMKRGAIIIDLRISQGGCFETTCAVDTDSSFCFEQYGVLHYCRPNISNLVARTASMALSNLCVPQLLSIGDAGNMVAKLKSDPGFKNGAYLYCGKPVNDYVSSQFNIRSNNIDIYLVAF